MVTQTRVRNESHRDYTKYMIQLRHASQITGFEANEIVLLNSHNGTSNYQILAGMFRFVCSNGLVCGDTVADVRIPHKGAVTSLVIEDAYEVLQGFEYVRDARDSMRAITLDDGETQVFARSALALSLTENIQREAMHPADQFEALAALVAEGRPIEDIAADFSVTPLVVQRRLKLANVSPRLMADYYADVNADSPPAQPACRYRY